MQKSEAISGIEAIDLVLLPRSFPKGLSIAFLVTSLASSGSAFAVSVPAVDDGSRQGPGSIVWEADQVGARQQLERDLSDALNLSGPDTKPVPKIDSVEQAKAALAGLETALRERGDISAIVELAPLISAQMPDNQTIAWLESLALAANGDAAAALKRIQGLKTGPAEALYAALANAAIAKARGRLDDAALAAERAITLNPQHPYAYNLLGQIQATRGQLPAAAKSFASALQKAPQFAAAHSNLGSALVLQGDLDGAWGPFTTAIELAPGYCAPRMGRATLSQSRNDRAAAITDLEACVNSTPTQTPAVRRLAAFYVQSNRLDDAARIVQLNEAADPTFARNTLADIQLRRNNTTAAIKTLQGADDPSGQGHYLLSFANAIDGRLDIAIQLATDAGLRAPTTKGPEIARFVYSFYDGRPVGPERLRALEKDPGLGKLAAFVEGSVELKTGDAEAGHRAWTKATDLVPGFTLKGVTAAQLRAASSANEQKHLSFGMLLYLKQFYPASLSQFTKAVTANPNSMLGNYMVSLLLEQTGKADEDNQYLRRSLAVAPGFFAANYLLAERYLRERQFEKALTHYQTASASQADAAVLVKLGLLQEMRGHYENAAATYRRLIDAYPNDFLGYNQLAWLYAKRGQSLDEALRLAQRANELRPGNSSVNDTIGWAFLQKNDLKNAARYLQQANTISKGRNSDILFHLATLEYKKGNKKAARTLAEKALANSKQFESASATRELLARLKSN